VAFFDRLRRVRVAGSSGGASGGITGGGADALRPSARSRRRMPCCDRNAEMLAGVEFRVWAIQTSVRPCSTHWRISSRYGFRVAFCVGTAGSLSAPAACAAALAAVGRSRLFILILC
jgi:hypothetical protein